MTFSTFEHLLSFQRYSSFCSKIDDVTNRFSTKINNKIKDISRSIGVMLLKLSTNNVSQVRNKMTSIMTLSWYFSRPQSLSVMNQIVSIFDQIRRGRQSHLKRTKCPYCSTSPYQLMGSNDV